MGAQYAETGFKNDMPDKTIRIIKREQREFPAEQQEVPSCELKTENQTRREIFETITLWIEEQRQRKNASTILSFERLLGVRRPDAALASTEPDR